jgi:hypothetical protein
MFETSIRFSKRDPRPLALGGLSHDHLVQLRNKSLYDEEKVGRCKFLVYMTISRSKDRNLHIILKILHFGFMTIGAIGIHGISELAVRHISD